MARPIVSFVPLLLLLPQGSDAEDLKLSNGAVFREVKVVEVRPDALVFTHREGIAMADLEKLPPAVRARYGYDARRASEFRERETAKRQVAATEAARLVAADEARKMAQARARYESTVAASSGRNGDFELSYSFGPSAADRISAAAATSVGGQIERAAAAREAAVREEGTFWGSPIWKNPVVKLLGGLLGAGQGGERDASAPRNWR